MHEYLHIHRFYILYTVIVACTIALCVFIYSRNRNKEKNLFMNRLSNLFFGLSHSFYLLSVMAKTRFIKNKNNIFIIDNEIQECFNVSTTEDLILLYKNTVLLKESIEALVISKHPDFAVTMICKSIEQDYEKNK